MALTPDDVLQKRFETTRFRDGYDQDEVDDFLDEVVAELKRLGTENEQLKASAAAPAGGQQADAGELKALRSENTDLKKQLEAARAEAAANRKAADTAEAAAAEAREQASKSAAVANERSKAAEPAAVAGVVPGNDQKAKSAQAPAADPAATQAGSDSSALIALAQRVHDEHVANGEKRRDELIAAAEVSAREIETKAEERKSALDAEIADQRAKLEEQKSGLEAKIDELKSFERDYRLKLRGYIESQLRDLDRSSSLAFGGQSNNSGN